MLDLQTNGSVIAEPENNAARERPKNHSRTLGQTSASDQLLTEQQNKLAQSVSNRQYLETKPSKDVWDKIAAVAPIVSGFLIFATGTYCTFNFNQQQLKIQEVQTIEKFIPHLMGNEQSKKAAIMALSSMTNTETAGKVAQIFASSGTVSALQSLTQSGSEKDKAIATQALSNALQNLADRESKLSSIEADYKKALVAKDQQAGESHPDTPYNLNKLAQLYTMRGQYDLAEPLLKRSLAIREKIYGVDNPEVADALKSLAELYQLSGKSGLAEISLKRARAIEERLNNAQPHFEPQPQAAIEEQERVDNNDAASAGKAEAEFKNASTPAHDTTRVPDPPGSAAK
jgi:Tetratricopeptide repeat